MRSSYRLLSVYSLYSLSMVTVSQNNTENYLEIVIGNSLETEVFVSSSATHVMYVALQ
jgi:hypothetical protein